MANKTTREEIRAALIQEKVSAGLRPDQAAEVADRQIAHDESLAKADETKSPKAPAK
jgi:hypothetical protein